MASKFYSSPNKNNEDSFSYKKAKELAQFLEKRNELIKSPNLNNWSKEIDKLLNFHKEETISKVMKWLLSNFDGQYTPTIKSAERFRLKFDDMLKTVSQQLPTMDEISDRAESIFIAITTREYEWPGRSGTKKVLLPIIQRSVENYDLFYAKFEKYYEANKDDWDVDLWHKDSKGKERPIGRKKDIFTIAKKLHGSWISGCTGPLVDWFEVINERRRHKITVHTGNFDFLVWRVDHEVYHAFICEKCDSWEWGGTGRWVELVEDLENYA